MYKLETYFFTDEAPICGLLIINSYLIVAGKGGIVQLRELKFPYDLIKEIATTQDPFISFASMRNPLFMNKDNEQIIGLKISELEISHSIPTSLSNTKIYATSPNYIAIANNQKIKVLLHETGESVCVIERSSNFNRFYIENMEIWNHKLFWKKNYEDRIHIYDLKTGKEERVFTSDCSIMNYIVRGEYLIVAINECLETGNEPCSLEIWDLISFERVIQLGVTDLDSYFIIRTVNDATGNPTILYATTMNEVDFWEWGTWRHLQRIEGLGNAHEILLVDDTLFVGDTEGWVQVLSLTIPVGK